MQRSLISPVAVEMAITEPHDGGTLCLTPLCSACRANSSGTAALHRFLLSGLQERLGSKREAAILALLTARSIEDAARTANVPPRTLHRWILEPEFDAAYRKARRAAFSQSTARLQQATSAAVSTLLKIMVDAGAPPSVRVRAADSVLDHAKQAIEIEDVEVRVAALEQAAKLSGQDR
jgi:hypothetical protein